MTLISPCPRNKDYDVQCVSCWSHDYLKWTSWYVNILYDVNMTTSWYVIILYHVNMTQKQCEWTNPVMSRPKTIEWLKVQHLISCKQINIDAALSVSETVDVDIGRLQDWRSYIICSTYTAKGLVPARLCRQHPSKYLMQLTQDKHIWTCDLARSSRLHRCLWTPSGQFLPHEWRCEWGRSDPLGQYSGSSDVTRDQTT